MPNLVYNIFLNKTILEKSRKVTELFYIMLQYNGINECAVYTCKIPVA